MNLRIGDKHKFWAGLLFLAIGVCGAISSSRYDLGNATHMGPGYFPVALSILLGFLGVAAAILALRSEPSEPIGTWPFMPLLCVSAAVIIFALLIDSYGLLAAVIALVGLSCYQRWLTRPIELVVIAVVLGTATIGIFIFGLQLPLNVF